jgi:cytochrome P450
LGITETTVLSQGLIFLIAGFDTTATTLTVLSYQLAEHPEIQTKLLQEIDEYMGRNNGTIKHETLG